MWFQSRRTSLRRNNKPPPLILPPSIMSCYAPPPAQLHYTDFCSPPKPSSLRQLFDDLLVSPETSSDLSYSPRDNILNCSFVSSSASSKLRDCSSCFHPDCDSSSFDSDFDTSNWNPQISAPLPKRMDDSPSSCSDDLTGSGRSLASAEEPLTGQSVSPCSFSTIFRYLSVSPMVSEFDMPLRKHMDKPSSSSSSSGDLCSSSFMFASVSPLVSELSISNSSFCFPQHLDTSSAAIDSSFLEESDTSFMFYRPNNSEMKFTFPGQSTEHDLP